MQNESSPNFALNGFFQDFPCFVSWDTKTTENSQTIPRHFSMPNNQANSKNKSTGFSGEQEEAQEQRARLGPTWETQAAQRPSCHQILCVCVFIRMGARLRGHALRGDVLGTFWKTPFLSEPFLTINHSKSPSKNPSPEPSPEPFFDCNPAGTERSQIPQTG